MEQNKGFVCQTQCKQYISQPTPYKNRCLLVSRNALTFPQFSKISKVLALFSMPLSLASSKALSLGHQVICSGWFPLPGAAQNDLLCLKMPAKVPRQEQCIFSVTHFQAVAFLYPDTFDKKLVTNTFSSFSVSTKHLRRKQATQKHGCGGLAFKAIKQENGNLFFLFFFVFSRQVMAFMGTRRAGLVIGR